MGIMNLESQNKNLELRFQQPHAHIPSVIDLDSEPPLLPLQSFSI
jgi:hypothetical protein